MATSASNLIAFPTQPSSGAEARPRVPNKLQPCAFPGCVNLRKARELCASHDTQRRSGLALVALKPYPRRKRNTDLVCEFQGCGKNRFVKTLCGAHYAQAQRGQDLRPAATSNYGFCSRCKDESKPRTVEFFCRKSKSGGLDSLCRSCNRAEKQANKDRAHAAYLKRTYNIPADWYRQRLVEQDGKCAICRSVDPGPKGRFHVDHDHDTGNVRALLCAWCNSAIGYMRDKSEVAMAAAAYLGRFGK